MYGGGKNQPRPRFSSLFKRQKAGEPEMVINMSGTKSPFPTSFPSMLEMFFFKHV